MSIHPSVKWAQRSDRLYITVDVQNAKDVQHDLIESPAKLTFKCSDEKGTKYEFEIELYADISKSESEYKVTGRSVEFNIKKKESNFWPRLTQTKDKLKFITVDWDKWVDEDEEEEEENFDWQGGAKFGDNMPDFGGMSLGDMGGMPNFGGAADLKDLDEGVKNPEEEAGDEPPGLEELPQQK